MRVCVGEKHYCSRLDERKRRIKHIVDDGAYFVSILGPVMTLPQLSVIWVDKNVSGLSIISWFSYLIISFVWLAYGIVHKQKQIIFSSTVWVFLQIFIVVGIFIYG